MIIRHPDIEIVSGSPFANCKLGRKKYADILTSIINSAPDGFVLAMNNKWGTGKTTFVRMWEQQLKDQQYRTVYFNAWENDFEDNPLIALVGELKTIVTKKAEPEFKSVLKKAAVISKHLAPTIAKTIADRYIKTDTIKDAITDVTKGLAEIFESEVDEYAKKRKGIAELRNSLSEFILKTGTGSPLVFIIDELDRCRPNYAVSILEQIKHFFSVSNIVFVLSIDKDQLGNAVRGVYGSDLLDADEYLRRFIDLEYSIPEPDPGLFHTYLHSKMNFDSFFLNVERRKYPELQNDHDNFKKICKALFFRNEIPLRQQERIFTLARLSLNTFNLNQYVIPSVFLFLAYIKVVHPKFYEKMKRKQLNLSEFQIEFGAVIKPMLTGETTREFLWLEANILTFYNNYHLSHYDRMPLFENDGTGKNKLLISSSLNPNENDTLLQMLEGMHRGRGPSDISLEYFLDKIELLNQISL